MLQKPNTVFVGSKVNAAATSLAVGDVVLINAATGAPLAIASIANANAIQLGYVKAIGSMPKRLFLTEKTKAIFRVDNEII